MASKYKLIGPPGHGFATRDFKRWVIVFSGGEELCLSRKRYAWAMAKAMLAKGCNINVYEETVIRSVFANDERKDDLFRIDVTNRVKHEIEIGELTT